MQDLRLLIVIIQRESDEIFTSFFREHGVVSLFGALCRGTAGRKLLSLLGLEEAEKALLFTMLQRKKAMRLMAQMVSELGLDMPGQGIALTLPVASIGGASSLKYLTENQNIIIGEVTDMQEKQAFQYELIVAIAERGHVDTVMDAARAAGAMGGTIIHAKGTNPHADDTFFGMSLADEKEMLLIVTAARDKGALMRAIMDKAGVASPAHTVMFSLPVESVAGLKSVMAGENGAGPGEE